MKYLDSPPRNFLLDEIDLINGIKLCADKAKQLLADANLLINNRGSLSHALGLYIFAVEEYGKGLLLQRQLQHGQKNASQKYVVPASIFGYSKFSHPKKIKKALKVLPTDCKNITVGVNVSEASSPIKTIKSGKKIVSKPDWSPGTFSSTTDSIEEDTRWRCFYVDWDYKDGYWKYQFLATDNDQFSNAISIFIKILTND